jgi:integrase
MIAARTQQLYDSMLRRVWRDDEPNEELLLDLPLPSRKIASVAIVRKMRDLGRPQEEIDKYGKIARDSRLEDNMNRVNRKSTKQEQENFIPWAQVLARRESMKNYKEKGIKDHMKYIVICMFTMIAPQRGEVFMNCFINRDVEGSNIIDLTTKEFTVREHKTKRTRGTFVIPLPDELVSILTNWLEDCVRREVNADSRLIFAAKCNPVQPPNFTSMMNAIFNSKISTDMIRKIYITHRVAQGMTMQERIDLAASMDHTLFQQEFTYNKKDIEINNT